jgi:hypothetical protein
MKPNCQFCGNELRRCFPGKNRYACEECKSIFDVHHDGSMTEVKTYNSDKKDGE